MSVKVFQRTQQAIFTPFEPNRNPGFGGVRTDIESTDVQNAIEEVKQDAINNDRFLLLCSYNGNANVGRYLEFFQGIDSSIAPIYEAVDAKCLTIVSASTANATCTLGFFNLSVSSVTPIYTVTHTAQRRVVINGTPALPLFVLLAAGTLAVRVTSGSINRPHMYFSLSAAT